MSNVKSQKLKVRCHGFSRVELILTGAGLLVLIILLALAVLDTRRRSRDTSRVSEVRQIEAVLHQYRYQKASYPADLQEVLGDIASGFSYQAYPEGCGADTEALCDGYLIGFGLEGPVGSLPGGQCSASPEGISCTR